MYKATVKVSFKDKKGQFGPANKKYGGKKQKDFYESTAEAVKDLGERNTLEMINAKLKDNYALVMREQLIAKVAGEGKPDTELEEVDLDD